MPMSFSDILIIQGNFVDASPGQRESQMCQHVAPVLFFRQLFARTWEALRLLATPCV